MDEKELVEKAKSDNDAFSQLYELYFPKIYGYVMKRVGNREEAEDIVSQTFMKVVEKLPKFDAAKGSLKSWIYAIATNVMIDYFRKSRHRSFESIEFHTDSVIAPTNPHEQTKQEEDRRYIFRSIAELPEKYQQILILKYYGDLEQAEIAETLGISLNHVAVLLHRAIQKFEKIYSRFHS